MNRRGRRSGTSRRRFLASSVASTVAVAGCASVEFTQDTGWVEVSNFGANRTNASVTITRTDGNETVFDRRVALDGDGHEGFGKVLSESGRYRVVVRSENRMVERAFEYNETRGWTGISIWIDEDGIEISRIIP